MESLNFAAPSVLQVQPTAQNPGLLARLQQDLVQVCENAPRKKIAAAMGLQDTKHMNKALDPLAIALIKGDSVSLILKRFLSATLNNWLLKRPRPVQEQ